MAKTFYTELDIELLFKQGVTSLVVNEDVVLTELAREKAERLGVALVREDESPPSAPVRPYLTQTSPSTTAASAAKTGGTSNKAALRQQVRDKVIAPLGNEVDPKLLETIISRVLDNVGISKHKLMSYFPRPTTIRITHG